MTVKPPKCRFCEKPHFGLCKGGKKKGFDNWHCPWCGAAIDAGRGACGDRCRMAFARAQKLTEEQLKHRLKQARWKLKGLEGEMTRRKS